MNTGEVVDDVRVERLRKIDLLAIAISLYICLFVEIERDSRVVLLTMAGAMGLSRVFSFIFLQGALFSSSRGTLAVRYIGFYVAFMPLAALVSYSIVWIAYQLSG
jgi:hypothetical protein